MLHPSKPVRSPELAAVRLDSRRRPRLFEIEFHFAHEASPPGSQAALEVVDHPAHASSAAVLAGEIDPRLARAIAAASGWVVERYR